MNFEGRAYKIHDNFVNSYPYAYLGKETTISVYTHKARILFDLESSNICWPACGEKIWLSEEKHAIPLP